MCTRCAAVVAVAALALAASAPAGATSAAKRAPTIQILVTNDDGYAAPGIDALVEALRSLRRVKVTVFAPATNQSGTSDKTTPVSVGTSESHTASGYPATVVAGYPADSVAAALEGAAKKPNVVIVGINQGQNLGALVDVSGTVGAARTAARRGVPALAVSQGLGNPPDYDAAARLAVKWFEQHRKAVLKRTSGTATVQSLNVPTCATGKVRGLIEVPVAPTAENAIGPSDCSSSLTRPVDDIQAFTNGYATLSTLSTS